MTETQADLMEIKATLKKMQEDIDIIKYGKYVNSPDMQNAMFNTWLNQYDNPDFFSVCKPHNDEYIGGPVAGYCPDYMKERKL